MEWIALAVVAFFVYRAQKSPAANRATGAAPASAPATAAAAAPPGTVAAMSQPTPGAPPPPRPTSLPPPSQPSSPTVFGNAGMTSALSGIAQAIAAAANQAAGVGTVGAGTAPPPAPRTIAVPVLQGDPGVLPVAYTPPPTVTVQPPPFTGGVPPQIGVVTTGADPIPNPPTNGGTTPIIFGFNDPGLGPATPPPPAPATIVPKAPRAITGLPKMWSLYDPAIDD